MKAEINNENKRRFFGLYTDALIHTDEGGLTSLLLKPLSSISDEDLFGINFTFPFGKPIDFKIEFFLEGYEDHWKASGNGSKSFGNLKLSEIDFLRSRGYALPYLGISVEEQIEAGWIKLIES